MKSNRLNVLLALLVLAFFAVVVQQMTVSQKAEAQRGLWSADDGTRWNVYEELLTITAAGGADTTARFLGDRYMQIVPLPGATANKDSFCAAASGDSCKPDIYIQGWSDKVGGVCLGSIKVFDPFVMGTYATSANFDSASRTVDLYSGLSYGKGIAAYTAGTGTWDSLRIDLRNMENRDLPRIWPYVRIIIHDADTKVGKNYATRMRVYGYTP